MRVHSMALGMETGEAAAWQHKKVWYQQPNLMATARKYAQHRRAAIRAYSGVLYSFAILAWYTVVLGLCQVKAMGEATSLQKLNFLVASNAGQHSAKCSNIAKQYVAGTKWLLNGKLWQQPIFFL
ncbi:hypothetical protein NPIL_355461 [Nephila pilipes]|uniref:Uncharacterized protein n=1 Tax=Nephila pilipes TaxID=299642 RepID=A0A8X6QSK9_NEPPI|nr:hypothetical protein NPIL_355461 [Nephila pilipes]